MLFSLGCQLLVWEDNFSPVRIFWKAFTSILCCNRSRAIPSVDRL